MVLNLGDNLREWVTAIVVSVLIASPAAADVDLGLSGTGRSYPLSAVAEADMGYDYLLWGKPIAGSLDNSPWYGYLRASVNGDTAITYNSLGGALDIFPLSFFGMRVGGEGVQNDSDYSAFDCVTYQCRGRFYRTYVQAQITLGAAGFFGQLRWRRERWSAADVGAPFIEPTNAVALAGGGDAETVLRALVGYKMNPVWTTALVLVYAQADSTRQVSRFPFVLLAYHFGEYSLGAGAGAFSSTLKPIEPSGLIFLTWQVQPGLAL